MRKESKKKTTAQQNRKNDSAEFEPNRIRACIVETAFIYSKVHFMCIAQFLLMFFLKPHLWQWLIPVCARLVTPSPNENELG